MNDTLKRDYVSRITPANPDTWGQEGLDTRSRQFYSLSRGLERLVLYWRDQRLKSIDIHDAGLADIGNLEKGKATALDAVPSSTDPHQYEEDAERPLETCLLWPEELVVREDFDLIGTFLDNKQKIHDLDDRYSLSNLIEQWETYQVHSHLPGFILRQ
ncbi:hypothetical protein ABW21_db0205461 [Orbilia brochopaga]|nr:hypothetical protein ABW21_db0205461 [Drechslerella brochopaga]